MCTDAGEQLTGAEGFDQVVVGPVLQSFYPGFLACTGGEKDDRKGFERFIRPNLAHQSEAVQLRHHDVAQDLSITQVL
jgi:hypothetical protein